MWAWCSSICQPTRNPGSSSFVNSSATSRNSAEETANDASIVPPGPPARNENSSGKLTNSPPGSQRLAGVGVRFAGLDSAKQLVVETLVPGGAAEASKQILVGDTLVSVDGQSVVKLTDSEIAKLILGPSGTEVTVGLERLQDDGSTQRVEVCLIRTPIQAPAISRY